VVPSTATSARSEHDRCCPDRSKLRRYGWRQHRATSVPRESYSGNKTG